MGECMDWQDDAIVLENRAYGESGSIAQLFTREWGRHAGLVRGGTGKKLSPVLMPGNKVYAHIGGAEVKISLGATAWS